MPPAWAGKKLVELVPAGIRIAAVTRGGLPTLNIRDLFGQEGDVLQLLVTSDSEPALRAFLERAEQGAAGA